MIVDYLGLAVMAAFLAIGVLLGNAFSRMRNAAAVRDKLRYLAQYLLLFAAGMGMVAGLIYFRGAFPTLPTR